ADRQNIHWHVNRPLTAHLNDSLSPRDRFDSRDQLTNGNPCSCANIQSAVQGVLGMESSDGRFHKICNIDKVPDHGAVPPQRDRLAEKDFPAEHRDRTLGAFWALTRPIWVAIPENGESERTLPAHAFDVAFDRPFDDSVR